ncbi:MAG: flagellar biosynthesis protein FliQ [Alphaproteobacteria bacterium]|nr:flagellar biosynthesis protein FliQ [Alphaproteobacteria bacterium]
MTSPEILDLARSGIIVLLKTAGPIMLVALAVGLTVALFQALTQIQEMTLVFIPKIFAVLIGLLLLLPFMGAVMSGFMTDIMSLIVSG